MSITQTNTIPADLVRFVTRTAETARDWAFQDMGIRSEAVVDGILYAIEKMGCDAAELDALYDAIDAILTGGES